MTLNVHWCLWACLQKVYKVVCVWQNNFIDTYIWKISEKSLYCKDICVFEKGFVWIFSWRIPADGALLLSLLQVTLLIATIQFLFYFWQTSWNCPWQCNVTSFYFTRATVLKTQWLNHQCASEKPTRLQIYVFVLFEGAVFACVNLKSHLTTTAVLLTLQWHHWKD